VETIDDSVEYIGSMKTIVDPVKTIVQDISKPSSAAPSNTQTKKCIISTSASLKQLKEELSQKFKVQIIIHVSKPDAYLIHLPVSIYKELVAQQHRVVIGNCHYRIHEFIGNTDLKISTDKRQREIISTTGSPKRQKLEVLQPDSELNPKEQSWEHTTADEQRNRAKEIHIIQKAVTICDEEETVIHLKLEASDLQDHF
jgi:hypothetical protein